MIGDYAENQKWKNVDIDTPKDVKDSKSYIMTKFITSLTPNARYAFYMKEVVSAGEERASKIYYLTISRGSEAITTFYFYKLIYLS